MSTELFWLVCAVTVVALIIFATKPNGHKKTFKQRLANRELIVGIDLDSDNDGAIESLRDGIIKELKARGVNVKIVDAITARLLQPSRKLSPRSWEVEKAEEAGVIHLIVSGKLQPTTGEQKREVGASRMVNLYLFVPNQQDLAIRKVAADNLDQCQKNIVSHTMRALAHISANMEDQPQSN